MGLSGRTILLSVLVTSIIALGISFFFITRIDSIVNNDLYHHGLIYSENWWTQYSLELIAIFTSFGTAIIMSILGSLYISLKKRHKTDSVSLPRSGRVVLLSVFSGSIIALGISIFFLNRLDTIINSDLYSYGLQFKYEWFEPYWINLMIVFGLVGVASIADGVGIYSLFKSGYIITDTGSQRVKSVRIGRRVSIEQILSVILIAIGALSVAGSIIYSSSVLVFAGLGLIFWGGIFLYIKNENYVKETLLDTSTISSLAALDQMIMELGFKGKAIYLPPKYLKDFEYNRVYIPKEKHSTLPKPEDFLDEPKSFFLDESRGLFLEPPGSNLSKLFEKTLNTNFTKVDMSFFEENVPRVIIEDLEIAENVELGKRGNRIRIRLGKSVYGYTCREAKKLTNVSGSIGCPICSALACAITKTTGNPVSIEREVVSEDGTMIDVEYRIFRELPEED